MKESCQIISLALALGWICPAALPGAAQSPTGTTQGAPEVSQQVDDLQKQLDRLNAELASIKQQLDDSKVTGAALNPASRLDELQKQLDRLKGEINSLKEQANSLSPNNPVSSRTSIPSSTSVPAGGATSGATVADSPVAKMSQLQRVRNLAIRLTSDRGQFTEGQNSFCVEFREARTYKLADAGDVQVDFTSMIARVRVMRAISQVAQAATGQYCGRVVLRKAGVWSATVKYEGRSGRGKVTFPAAGLELNQPKSASPVKEKIVDDLLK